jgi:D-arabinono-1,4-lactone oxidase.
MNFRNETEKAWLEQYLILCKKKKYSSADMLLHKVPRSQTSRLHHYVGQYNHILCKERNNGIPHADIEFNFDYEKSLEVLNMVRSFCQNLRVPYYNFEIRTTKQDNALLSCCNGHDSMWIDFQAKAEDSNQFFGEMEKLLKPVGFRKHWAKGLAYTDPHYVVNQFPNINTFINLMGQIDPDGKFRNKQGDVWYQQISQILAGSYNVDANDKEVR